MKITDPEIIRTGERKLIETVKGDLDWDAIGEIVKQRINISSVESTGGEIVVHENQVAFRIDFMLKMDLSMMFDRDGVLIQDKDENQNLPGIEHRDFDLSDHDRADDEVGKVLDDDIDEILKESQDFWENKKNE